VHLAVEAEESPEAAVVASEEEEEGINSLFFFLIIFRGNKQINPFLFLRHVICLKTSI